MVLFELDIIDYWSLKYFDDATFLSVCQKH